MMVKELWVVPVVEDLAPFSKGFDALVRKRFGENYVFTKADRMFFEGMANEWCGLRKDAKAMIELIDKHGKIRAWFV